MSRTYEKLPIEAFGEQLITSMDLDPVYAALRHVGWDRDVLKRWLVAYWCFYSAGAACYLADHEGQEFWNALRVAAENTVATPSGGRWPRGHERRHFRGAACLKAVSQLRERYPRPEDFADQVTGGGLRLSCAEIMRRVEEHHLFGPWIGFKVADMAERVLGYQVDFTQAEVFMFDQPKEAALLLWRQRTGQLATAQPKSEQFVITTVVEHLVKKFSHLMAPPARDRPVGLQEVETVLCKWKSHLSGHYPLWNDVDEIDAGLEPWLNHSGLAVAFRTTMPERAK